MANAVDDDDDYVLPLEDQRVFGAGITRKRINFIPAASNLNTTTDATQSKSSQTRSSVAERYLSIVLPSSPPTESHESPCPIDLPPASATTTTEETCPICALPFTTATHESTITHQICLEHSHPPSHLDRSRHGLRYLSSYGWDPDERVGLGARAEGIRYPVKAVPKYDTVGLHERVDVEAVANGRAGKRKGKGERNAEGRVVMVNAKEVRRLEKEGKEKMERLRRMFDESEEVERYLGGG